MKNNKAPGISGITTDMIKTLPEEGFQILMSYIQQFWEDPDYDHEAWHKMRLMLLYKGEGKIEDLINWRGIYLKDIGKNIELDPCREITTEPGKNESRCKSIWSHGLPGTPSYPSFCTNPQMPMWTQNQCPFVNLIKAFDTIDCTSSPSPLQVLSKYGIPPKIQKP